MGPSPDSRPPLSQRILQKEATRNRLVIELMSLGIWFPLPLYALNDLKFSGPLPQLREAIFSSRLTFRRSSLWSLLVLEFHVRIGPFPVPPQPKM